MRSIERRFIIIKTKNPDWSSFLCFGASIKNQGFSEDRLKRMFEKLVEKKDYAKADKKGVIKFLLHINKPLKRT